MHGYVDDIKDLIASYEDPERTKERLSPEQLTQMLDDAMDKLYQARRGEEAATVDRILGVERGTFGEGIKDFLYKAQDSVEKMLPPPQQQLMKTGKRVISTKIGRKVAARVISTVEPEIPNAAAEKGLEIAANHDKSFRAWKKKQGRDD